MLKNLCAGQAVLITRVPLPYLLDRVCWVFKGFDNGGRLQVAGKGDHQKKRTDDPQPPQGGRDANAVVVRPGLVHHVDLVEFLKQDGVGKRDRVQKLFLQDKLREI